MSYALGQMQSSRQPSGVQVGSRAARDPILARASLAAADILAAAAHKPRARRPAFIQRELQRRFDAKTRALFIEKKVSTDQGVYDALRLAIADYYSLVGLRYIQRSLKKKYGSKFTPVPLGGLGALGDEGQDIGCAIGGGTTALVGALVGAYTGGAGTPLVGAAGTMAMTAAGCGADAAAAQGELAASQANAAQQQLQAAQVAAAAQAEASAARTRQIVTIGAIAGGALLLAGVGYMIVKA